VLEAIASPDPEPEKRLGDLERQAPVDTEADAILLFEVEPQTDDADTIRSEEAAPSRVTPFPTVLHAPPPVAEETVAEPVPPARTPRNWRNVVLPVLATVVLVQGGLIAYWMMSRSGSAAAAPTGQVTVTSEPAGSAVTIDGAVRGQTPLTIALNAGAHTISVGTGAVARSQTVNVTGGGESSMHVQLPPPVAAPTSATSGTLQIATEPPGARVSVDGTTRGTAPITISGLNAGDHVVIVHGADGGDPLKCTVTVREGATASLIITMPRAGTFASGWLAISSEVALQVMEKGELLGTTDTPRLLLPAGAHELELVNKGLDYRVTRNVTIASGQTATFAVAHPRGTLSVNALPWAEVWIDGQRAGETPIGNYSIPIGTHELVFRHPELGEQHKTVTIGAQGPVRVGVDMKKP